jgi:hypothetical protein
VGAGEAIELMEAAAARRVGRFQGGLRAVIFVWKTRTRLAFGWIFMPATQGPYCLLIAAL